MDTSGFLQQGRVAPSDGSIQVSLDDEPAAIRFPDDIVITMNPGQFEACLNTPTKEAIHDAAKGPEDRVTVWKLPAGQDTGVQGWINLPTTRFTPNNRALDSYLIYATSTAAGNNLRLAARPSLFSEGDDFRDVTTVYRDSPESGTANTILKRALITTANWTVLLGTGNICANIVCLRNGANAADTSTGDVYLLGIEVRIQKDKWTV